MFAIARLPLALCMIIYNTTPFWATLFSFLFLGESLICIEVLAMVFSFGGIILIAVSKMLKTDDSAEGADVTNNQFLAGTIFILVASFATAAAGVLTRRMQKIYYGLIMAHYQLFASLSIILVLTSESLITWTAPRLFWAYDTKQLLLILAASVSNSFAIQFRTIGE